MGMCVSKRPRTAPLQMLPLGFFAQHPSNDVKQTAQIAGNRLTSNVRYVRPTSGQTLVKTGARLFRFASGFDRTMLRTFARAMLAALYERPNLVAEASHKSDGFAGHAKDCSPPD